MGFLYVDEAGDPGFQLVAEHGHGSSELLVIAGVYFPTRADLHAFRLAYQGWHRGTQRPAGREFKFGNEKDYHRRGFLSAAMTASWTWDAFVLVKENIIARSDPDRWYRRSFNYLLTNVSQHAEEGSLVFADRRDMSKEVRQLFRQEVKKPKNTALPGYPNNIVEDFFGPLRFLDSKKSEGVQLADAVAGAVSFHSRSWKPARKEFLAQILERRHCLQAWP